MVAQSEVQDYGYNTRDELISGQGLAYNYDDIGNRITAEGKTYTANELNQYTAIDTFEPQYDVDGNQTLIKTSTGVWTVTYNAENRPVRWEQGDTVITMDFDRMGRRVFYKEEIAGEVVTHHKFVYDNYLCVQKLDALNNNSQLNLFVWDPTEPVATRPLFMLLNPGNYKFLYTFDGNKNVSERVHFESRNGIAAHYDYAPFGAVTRATNTSTITDCNFHRKNPFRFSSEYHDDILGLVYYNYRHYNPIDGRWDIRDPLEESILGINLFSYIKNTPITMIDLCGLAYVGKRPLDFVLGDIIYYLSPSIPFSVLSVVLSEGNLGPWHEQIIFEDNNSPSNIGLFSDNGIREDDTDIAYDRCCFEYPASYNDSLMRIAVENVSKQKIAYKLLPPAQYNCQDFVEDVIFEYERLEDEEYFKRQMDFRVAPKWVPHIVPTVN